MPAAPASGAEARAAPLPRDGVTDRARLLAWAAVAVFVRLLLAPLTVSSDLLAVYWRSHLIAYDGQLFDSYLVNMGAHYAHALSLRVLGVAERLWTDPWWWADASALVPQVQRAFVEQEGALGTLLTLKLPYIAADLAAGACLIALLRGHDPVRRWRAAAFWALSPIGLYATVLFGRYESFAVLAVVAALLLVERERPWAAAVVLGIGITMRTYPLLLVPAFALVAVGGRGALGVARHAAWAALAMVPFAAVMATNRILADSVGELSRLKDYSTGSTFFALTLPIDGPGEIALFVLAWSLLVGALLGRARGWWGTPVAVDELWLWLALLHAAMFAFATFSAHYFMWFAPFVALALARRPAWRGVLPLHLAQVVFALLLADLLGGPGTVLGLFQPLVGDAAMTAPSLREALLTSPSLTEQAATVLRTGFLAGTLLLMWPVVTELGRGWWGRPALA